MSQPVFEPMDIVPPKKMNLEASGVPVGTLEQGMEFEYILRFDQNIEMTSTLDALKKYFRRAKNERLKSVMLKTQANTNIVNALYITTEKDDSNV